LSLSSLPGALYHIIYSSSLLSRQKKAIICLEHLRMNGAGYAGCQTNITYTTQYHTWIGSTGNYGNLTEDAAY